MDPNQRIRSVLEERDLRAFEDILELPRGAIRRDWTPEMDPEYQARLQESIAATLIYLRRIGVQPNRHEVPKDGGKVLYGFRPKNEYSAS